MYYDYFGLKQPPFKITPDTSMFYPGGNRGAILEALIYTILNGEGIIKVVGEVGSGKTMLCRMLEKELPANVEVVYIANPSLSPENILHAIAFDLDLAVQADTSRLEVMNRLQEYLLAKHSAGQHVVIFIEEAQSMPVATLEEIRLLSNLETQQNKLLQIVMFGQPELDTIIGEREIRQLKERVTYSFQLNPFNTEDIRDYLNTRLRASGYRSGEIFQTQAVKLIEKYSMGLVRRINILADKAMLAAYAANTNQITAKHVRRAARDSEFVNHWTFRYGRQAALIALVVVIGTGTVWLFTSKPDTAPPSPDTSARLSVQQPDAIANDSAARSRSPEIISQQPPESREVNTNPAGPVETDNTTAPADDNPVITDSYDVTPGPVTKPEEAPADIEIQSPEAGKPAGTGEADTRAAAPPIDNSNQPGTGEDRAGIETQLLGMEGLFAPTEMGDNPYTDEELQLLREQLERYPPEVAYEMKPSADGDNCSLCWSIIYRPLIKTHKL